MPPFLLFLALFYAFFSASCQPYIGVNYGALADNLPPPSATARLLQSTTFSVLRLYDADPSLISALSGTGIFLLLGVHNADIPFLASSPSAATSWVSTNLLPFLPSSSISTISVGNEVLNSGDSSLSSALLPAMQNLRAALDSAAVTAAVKVSTVHSMAVLSQSDPPSAGAFHADLLGILEPILQFLRDKASPFMINPYPYFAYRSDPRPETLAFCLFQPGPVRVDAATGVSYSNMFDAQVDAIKSALWAAGFPGQGVVVAETGWPYKGDDNEVGASVENARAYTGNLVAHLRTMPEPVETYIFALYDENLKPGPSSERSFGLFRPDLTPIYDAGLMKSGSGSAASFTPAIPAEMSKPEECVAGGAAGCSKPVVEFPPNAALGRGAGGCMGLSWKDVILVVGLGLFSH